MPTKKRKSNNNDFCCPDHSEYDIQSKKACHYTPRDLETYHPQITSPWHGIWYFTDGKSRANLDETWANFHWDNLDLMLHDRFFVEFATKICGKCPVNARQAKCPTAQPNDPPCPQPAVKSPLVSKTRKQCVLSHFKICVGKCVLDQTVPIDLIICGCLYNIQGQDYRNLFSQGLRESLADYNSDNYDQYHNECNRPHIYLVIPKYAEMLSKLLQWVNQKYPNMEIFQTYSNFKSLHKDFHKIRFDIWFTFREMCRKVFLCETGLVEAKNWEEWPPVCR